MNFKKIGISLAVLTLLVTNNPFSTSNVNAAELIKDNFRKITITFNGDSRFEKGLTWYSDKSINNSDVQIVKKYDSSPDFSKAKLFKGRKSDSYNYNKEYVHKAEIKGLEANTTYYYRVGDLESNMWSDIGTFKTAPKSGAFTFIDLADPQAKNEDEAILAAETIKKSYKEVKKADFIAINGDIVDVGSNEKEWDWVLNHSKEVLNNITLLPVAGNHEEEAFSFIDHFNIKTSQNSSVETGAYYSVDYSNTHFIVLNNNEQSEEYDNFTPIQMDWMKKDISEAKKRGQTWIVLLMHKGLYTTSNHATDKDILGKNGLRTKLEPVISELGVDLVLQGHDHIYARTKPIKNGKAMETEKITKKLNGQDIDYMINPQGTIYFIPSTAGPKVYYKNSKIEKVQPEFYTLFEKAEEHHAAVYGSDEKDKRRPKRGVIQNFSSIKVDGNKLTVISYEIDQMKDGKPYIIDQFGIIKK